MPCETRVFFAGTSEGGGQLPSLADPHVMQQMFGLSPTEAASAAAVLGQSEVEERVDDYIALPAPFGHCIGLKGRGGGKKVEAKVIVPPPRAVSQTSQLDEWEKLTTKVDGGISATTSVVAWLRGQYHPAAQWAAEQVASGKGISVSVKKSRQGCSIASANAYAEQTDISLKVAGSSDAQIYRSWAVEGSSHSPFLSSVAAKWSERLAPLVSRGSQVVVDGYPGFVYRAALRALAHS